MTPIPITAYDLAKRYVGVFERSDGDHPLIQFWLSLCGFSLDAHDEIAWCSAFVNGMAWELGLPRSSSAAARSWLKIGTPIPLAQAEPGFDVVILRRGEGAQPGPEVVAAPGHVGFYGGIVGDAVRVRGGNQANSVSDATFPMSRILGIRRLRA